jgi:hypothetical protein
MLLQNSSFCNSIFKFKMKSGSGIDPYFQGYGRYGSREKYKNSFRKYHGTRGIIDGGLKNNGGKPFQEPPDVP